MREITVGVVAPAYVNVPLWIAQEREFLERRGLVATERICGTTHGVTSALRDGEVDIALTAPEGSIADAVAGGPLRVVAGLTDRPPLSMIALPRHHVQRPARRADRDVVPDRGHPACRGADARRARPDIPGRL